MKRTLNFRFLGLVLAVVTITAVSGHFLRAWQVRRNARYLVAQAGQAVNEKDFPKA